MPDHVVYYRDSDGLVVASTSSPLEIDIPRELAHYGPGFSALRVPDAATIPLKKRKVVSGALTYVDDLDAIAKKKKFDKDRADGIAELKKVGLTDDQLKALFGG